MNWVIKPVPQIILIYELLSDFISSFYLALHFAFYFALSKQDMHVVENQTEGLIMKSLLLHHSNPLFRSLRGSLLNMFVSHSFELSQQSLHLLPSACCSSVCVALQLLDNVYWLLLIGEGLSPLYLPISSPFFLHQPMFYHYSHSCWIHLQF